MSHTRSKGFIDKLRSIRSPQDVAEIFLRDTLAGQKAFLYNEKLPRVINISFTEFTCMYTCRMCPYHEADVREMYRDRSDMTRETLDNIIRSIPNDARYSFDISSIGETLIHKELPEFIAYLKRERPLVNTIISTNALPLTESTFRRLIESGLDSIQFSLYAGNATDHEYITGSKTFQRVADNLRMASRVRREMGSKTPYMQAFMIECEETRGSAKGFVEEWSSYVDKAFLRPLYNLGREIPGMTPVFEKPISEQRYPCITPWYSTAIRSNGDVLPCYMFHWTKGAKDQIVGNINDQTLEEIWASPAFRRFRDAHLSLDFDAYPSCQSCDLWAAYTDIWTRRAEGTFAYTPPSLVDCLKHRGGYRGG